MNPEDIVGSLLRGALSARGKRSHGTLGYLAGGPGSFLNASTLVSAAAVAWGMYEAAESRRERQAIQGSPVSTPSPAAAMPPLPLPPVAVRAAPQAPDDQAGVPPEVARLIRLLISAARADGDLSPEEGQQIARRAADTGAEALVRAELQDARPLAEIAAGVSDEEQKAELYTLAFSIVRADESVSGAERIYLAQLAKHFGLDAATVARLESEAAAHIDAAGGESNV
jgi:uncharacterized membrane protein YebE (DUF533 family)